MPTARARVVSGADMGDEVSDDWLVLGMRRDHWVAPEFVELFFILPEDLVLNQRASLLILNLRDHDGPSLLLVEATRPFCVKLYFGPTLTATCNLPLASSHPRSPCTSAPCPFIPHPSAFILPSAHRAAKCSCTLR